MPYQFVNIPEIDFGNGIDQQSAENNISPGYVEDALNADFSPTKIGSIKKRKGYQRHAGNLPIRIERVEYTDALVNNICFYLDQNITLPTGKSSPVIIKGKTNGINNAENVGDFPTDQLVSKYYDNFSTEIRKVFAPGINSLTIPQSEHQQTSPYLFVNLARSLSQTTNDNEQFLVDKITIDTVTYDITIDYQNLSGSSFTGFVYIADHQTELGLSYIQAGNIVPPGTSVITILSGTHNLNNNNILVKTYLETGGDLELIEPDSVGLNDSTGTITVTFTNNSGASQTVTIILASVADSNNISGSIAPGATQTAVISDIDSDFLFIGCYLEPSIGSPNLELIEPDNITVDSSARTATITFVNNNATSANYEIYWEFATIETNKICVTGEVISSGDVYSDDLCQLTLYGLDHTEIYSDFSARQGWVNHIDTYRSTSETKLIAGLGGNLFSAELDTDLSVTLYPNINDRVSADKIIGPAFYSTGEVPNRTRGWITGTAAGTNLFTISSVTYNSGTGYVDYLLDIPNMIVNGTLSTIISTVSGMEDRFTASQCGYAYHNQTFVIKQVTLGTNQLTISVENPDIDASDYDELDAGGLGGIFTDKITFTSSNVFFPDDILKSSLFSSETEYLVINNSGSETLISGAIETFNVPGGLRVTAERSSYIIPLRTAGNLASVVNLVRGDILSYTEINRPLTVRSINQLDSVNISITGDGETATVTLLSGDTSSLFMGKKLLINGSVSFNSVITITDLNSNGTDFTFSSDITGTETGVLIGKTIEVDEQLTFTDSVINENSFTVPLRWLPIESPTDAQDTTVKTVYRYFDTDSYINQQIVRSSMVQDSLYLAAGASDELLKYDGTDIYRAGLPRFQPQLFSTTDTSVANIVVDNPFSTYDSVSGTRFIFTTTPDDASNFSVGDQINDAQDNSYYNILEIKIDKDTSGVAVQGLVIVDRLISGTSGTKTITKISTYRYYARLNMIDKNNNIIASAATGKDDNVIRMGANAGVRLKLQGIPAYDLYDYDRLECEIYRTKKDSAAPYFKLVTIPISFDNNDGYINYVDSDSDDVFTINDIDKVNTALKGAELGTAWDQPLRAKYVTSAGNRLILGNLKGYPELNIQLLKTSGLLNQSVFTNSSNNLWQLKKDNTDTLTGTDMINRVRYEWTNNEISVSGITGLKNVTASGVNAGTDQISTAGTNYLQVGEIVSFSTSGTLPGGITAGTYYYIKQAVSSTAFTISLTPGGAVVDITTAGTGTLTINYNEPRFVVTTTTPHGYTANGQWVYLFFPNLLGTTNNLTYAGWYQIRVLDGTVRFVIYDDSTTEGAAVNYPGRLSHATDRLDVPVYIGTDANYNVLNGNYSSSEPYLFTAIRRLANAINASMRQADIVLAPLFRPWVVANAGNEYQAGQLVLKSPKIFTETLELTLPSLSGDFTVYVNNLKRASLEQISASTNLYPSRLIISYPNYPEIFDKPEATIDSDSDSTVDVNSADGQEITAIIPFFGSSAFGAALQGGVVVVFKTNSVYLVDLAAKAAGQNPVQQLETRGKGCSAPFSVALSKDAIMFVNESGIYCVTRDMKIKYVGEKYERKFNNNINLSNISLATGHHDSFDNKYKLSFPVISATQNSLVSVYNHTREQYSETGIGSWTTYDNHPAVGWANLNNKRFFASSLGKVFQIRNNAENSDYRDDSSAINFNTLTRALDQGDSGSRKVYRNFTTQYKTGDSLTSGTVLTAALDLKTVLQPTNSFRVNPNLDRTGIDDTGTQKIVSVQSNIQEKVGLYLQLNYQNNVIDEPVEITGISVTVANKGVKGVTKAKET